MKFPSAKAVKTYADAKIIDGINDAETSSAPSQNAVFDALALKANATDVTTSLALKEDAANKTLSVTTDGASDEKFPSAKAVKTYVDTAISSSSTTAVPYTGATAPVNLGSFDINAKNAKFTGNIYTVNPTITSAYNNANYENNHGLVIHTYNQSGATSLVSFIATGKNSGNYNSSINFLTRPQSANSVPLERLRITNEGKVGIGTTAPTATLDVVGSGNFSTDLSVGGTITSGIWNGTEIAITKGGTGATTAAAALTNLGAQSSANLSTNLTTDAASLTKYPAVKTIKDYVDSSVSSGAPDATASLSGKIQLAGDLTGSAASPAVATGAITEAKLADNAVTSAKIKDGEIVDADLSASAAIADTKLATITTAGKVDNSATTATDANTALAIVARDANGDFTAGTITANLTGVASKATNLNGGNFGDIAYQSAANTSSFLSGNTSATKKFLTQTGTGSAAVAPAWGTVGTADITDLGTNVATFLTTPSSVNLANAITNKTGTGSLVFNTSPTLYSPTLGTASATSIAFSGAGSSTGTSTIVAPSVSGSVTITLPDASGTLATLDGTETLTNKTLTSPILVTPEIGAATGTSLSVTGQLTSTVAIGTAPFVVTSTTPVANLSIGGNAATVTTNANLTGDVTSSGNTTTIGANKVVTGMIADANVTDAKLDKTNIPLSGFGAAAADVDMGTSYKVINVADPTNAQDASTKNYVDTNFVDLTTNQDIDGLKTFISNDGFIASGTMGAGTASTLPLGNRMMWYPQKSAFRVGYLDGDDASIGNYSFATGNETVSSGNNSAAFGYKTQATESNAFAIGSQTLANQVYSFASGDQTKATATASTAMGYKSEASGVFSLATGSETLASGSSSTALGYKSQATENGSLATGSETLASGSSSTAMGYKTTASGFTSLATGSETIASGSSSTALGYKSDASGYTSLASGSETVASGSSSTSFGYKSQATQSNAFATGSETISDGVNSASFGYKTQAVQSNAFAIGSETLADGVNAVAFGNSTQATQSNAFATGSATIASGVNSAAFGNTTQATQSDAFATGNETLASGFTSTAMGYKTQATDSSTFAIGSETVASGSTSTAMGYKTVASGVNSLATGSETLASGSSSTAMGYKSEASGGFSLATGSETLASGSSSAAMGYKSQATGFFSLATGSETLASGSSSAAMGYKSKATGFYSLATGNETLASESSSTAMGYKSKATGIYSLAAGNETLASGPSSFALGNISKARGSNSVALGIGINANSFSEIAIGSFNTNPTAIDSTSFNVADRLFVIGNGTDVNTLSDAVVVLKNGDTTINGILNAGGITYPNTDGTSGQVLTTNGTGTLSFSSIPSPDLATGVTGVLPLANGGTGSATQNFVDLTTAQTIAGVKTLSSDMIVNSVNIGRGNGAVATNTAVGKDAISATATGADNTALGYNTLKAITSGTGNTAVGSQAALAITSGTGNTAVGSQAALAMTTGTNNTVFGSSALSTLTSSQSNTAIGNDALKLLGDSTNDRNTAVGTGSFANLTTGQYNVGLGMGSLLNATSGSNNVALGKYAGFRDTNNAGVSSSNQSIFIGSETKPLNATSTNEIVIGYDARGLGNNTTVIGNSSSTQAKLFGALNLPDATTSTTATTGALTVAGGAGIAENLNVGGDAKITGTLTVTSGAGAGKVLTSDANGLGTWTTPAGVTTMAAIGSTPNANGATISGVNLNLEPASATYGGVVTTGTQTFAGAKTFSPSITAASSLGIGTKFTPTLTAAAIGDILVGLDIDPTFVNGTYTALSTYGMRVQGIGFGLGGGAVTSNIAIGSGTLINNSTGSNNTGLGYRALQLNSNGIDNTAIGYNAGDKISSGSKNIFVGSSAGSKIATGTTSNATGANSVLIGYDVRPAADGQTNQIVISGYNGTAGTVGLGSNTTLIGSSTTTDTRIMGALDLPNATASTSTTTGALKVAGGAGIAGNTYIGGTISIAGGSPGAGKVLTSTNSSGIASWTTISAVPYTGATGAVNLGAYDLTVNGLTVGKGKLNDASNTAIGIDVLKNNDNSSGGGYNNTALGASAMAANTTGIRNTAVGKSALGTNQTGSNNTAIGDESLVQNKADSNTAVGAQSLNLNNNGTGNTAIGYYALRKNTSGNYNVAVGTNANNMNQTGNNNVAIGYQALYDAADTSSTSDNTAIGYLSMSNKPTGNNNTAVGSQSNKSNTSGAGNVAFGWKSLYYNATGSYNTALGYNSGNTTTTNVLTNGIYIGYNALPKASTNTDEIVIGSNLTGNGSNTVSIGNSSNTANYLKGILNVAAGTAATSTDGISSVITAQNAGTGGTNAGGSVNITAGNGNSSGLGGNIVLTPGTSTTAANKGIVTVNGQVKIADGTQGAGKVLTSDANGLATWTNASGSAVTTTTTSYAITLAESIVFYTGSAAGTFSIPDPANGNAGKEITIKNKTAFGITITPTSTGKIYIDSANTAVNSVSIGIEASNNWIKLVSDGSQWNVLRALF